MNTPIDKYELYQEDLHSFYWGFKGSNIRNMWLFLFPPLRVYKRFHFLYCLPIMSTELIAVFLALEWIHNTYIERVVILLDSLSRLTADLVEEWDVRMVWWMKFDFRTYNCSCSGFFFYTYLSVGSQHFRGWKSRRKICVLQMWICFALLFSPLVIKCGLKWGN